MLIVSQLHRVRVNYYACNGGLNLCVCSLCVPDLRSGRSKVSAVPISLVHSYKVNRIFEMLERRNARPIIETEAAAQSDIRAGSALQTELALDPAPVAAALQPLSPPLVPR